MSADYEVLLYRPEHRPQVLELQKHLWSSDVALNGAYFEWKYEQNPYLSEVPVYLAFHRGELVGMRGFHGSRWEAGTPRQESLIFCADDLAIAPEHRNRGLFTEIMDAALADLSSHREGFALTLSGGLMTVLGSLTMGWKSIGAMQPVGHHSAKTTRLRRWRRVMSRVPLLRRLAESAWLKAPGQFTRLDAETGPGSSRSASIRVVREADTQAMASLVGSLGYDGRIRHLRDAQYFAWRFRNPLREYRFLYAGGSRLTGYLVLGRWVSDRAAFVPIHLSDWEASSPEVGAALLRAALLEGAFPEVVVWAAALPGWAPPVLAEAGFVPVDQELVARGYPCVLVRPLHAGVPDSDWTLAGKNLLAPASWDLRMLYSMRG